MVIGGELGTGRPHRAALEGFNGAADGDRRRAPPLGAGRDLERAASTEPPMVIGGEGSSAPAPAPSPIPLQRSRRW